MKTTFVLFLQLLAFNVCAQDGTLDTSFDPETGADGFVQRIAVQPDGKIVLVGSFENYAGTWRRGVARINTDGSLDTSFDPGSGIPISWGQYARAVAIQPDGKIMVGGVLTNYNNNFSNGLFRINADGSFDPTFLADNVTGFGVNEVDVIRVQPDGKILVGGPFGGSGTHPSKGIIRFNADGTVDQSFNAGTGAANGTGPSNVSDIAIQPDGKIILVGSFQTYNDVQVNSIARVNTDGSLDNTFSAGTGADNIVSSVSLQPDGKIIVTGWFHSINGTPRWNVARLNADGTVDTSFEPNFPATPATYITKNALQQDGKIVLNGSWMRVYASGPLDTTTWHNGIFNGPVSDIAVQPDGKILMCGNFTLYDGASRNRIVRLNGNGSSSVSHTRPIEATVYPNPFQTQTVVTTEAPFRNATVVIVNSVGQVVKETRSINGHVVIIERNGLPNGLYLLRVTDENGFRFTRSVVITD